MEILQKFLCTSRIGLNLNIVQKSFSTIFRLYLVTMLFLTELFPDGQRNSGRVWRVFENKPGTRRKVRNHTKISEVKFKKLLEIDLRYTVKELAKAIGISLSKVHFILKKTALR